MKKILMIVAVGMMSLPMFAQTTGADQIYRKADVMPVFKECQDERFADYPYRCTLKQVAEHLQNEIIMTNPLGGVTKALLYFVVEKDGTVSGVEIQRGTTVRDEDGQENKTLQLMLDGYLRAQAGNLTFQSPAYMDGEPVRVSMQMSVPLNY